jgi:hypothetical protein
MFGDHTRAGGDGTAPSGEARIDQGSGDRCLVCAAWRWQRDGGMDGSGRAQSQLAAIPSQTHYTILNSPVVVTYANEFLQ